MATSPSIEPLSSPRRRERDESLPGSAKRGMNGGDRRLGPTTARRLGRASNPRDPTGRLPRRTCRGANGKRRKETFHVKHGDVPFHRTPLLATQTGAGRKPPRIGQERHEWRRPSPRAHHCKAIGASLESAGSDGTSPAKNLPRGQRHETKGDVSRETWRRPLPSNHSPRPADGSGTKASLDRPPKGGKRSAPLSPRPGQKGRKVLSAVDATPKRIRKGGGQLVPGRRGP